MEVGVGALIEWTLRAAAVGDLEHATSRGADVDVPPVTGIDVDGVEQ
jgi:hypothetical protein